MEIFIVVVHVHVLLYLSRINTAYVSLRHYNAAARQNNVPSESSFATKSALFGPKNVCPFQILDLTLRPLGFPNFSQSSFEILTWNLVYDLVLTWYRSSLTFVSVDQLLLELLPFAKMSVHSVFRTFLSHPLRYWLEIWHTTLSWDDTDQVWLLSRLTYFYLSYCPLQKCPPTRFSELFSVILWDIYLKFGIRSCLDMIQIRFDFCLGWPPFTWVIALCKNVRPVGFPNFSQSSFEILYWNLVYDLVAFSQSNFPDFPLLSCDIDLTYLYELVLT